MTKRILSLILCLSMIFGLLPETALAATPVNMIVLTMPAPKAGAMPATAEDLSLPANASTYVQSVVWKGELERDGCFKSGVAYTVNIGFSIKPGVNRTFTSKSSSIKATINDKKAAVAALRDDYLEIKYTWNKLPGDHSQSGGQAAAGEYLTESEANTLSTPKGLTIIAGSAEEFVQNAPALENRLDVTKLVASYPINGAKIWDFYHLKEVWLGPEVDLNNFFLEYTQPHLGDWSEGAMNRGDCVFYISGDKYPQGLQTKNADGSWVFPTFKEHSGIAAVIKLYSGDVNTAAAQGAAAGRDWCPGHSYTYQLVSADRMMRQPTCDQTGLAYYSCANCGQCERNASHTFQVFDTNAQHANAAQRLTDEAYVGVNAAGKAVYWYSCAVCGRSAAATHVDYTPADHLASYGPNAEITYDRALKMKTDAVTKATAEVLAGTKEDGLSHGLKYFTVDNKSLDAKVSVWAKSDVRWAQQHGLVDSTLLGGDYTQTISRLQFCSVVVQLAENMTGKTIVPAAAATFSDTQNDYVLKAYAAGITGGTAANTFSPDETLTRQQMAAFLYNALQYVKKNSDTLYTPYESKLAGYRDATQIQSWAKEPMAFMNALGLVSGTSADTLSPNANCTIEQALVVANRSLDADKIGWYMVRSDRTLARMQAEGSDIYARHFFRAPTETYETNTTYCAGERYWVNGKAVGKSALLYPIVDQHTGDTLYGRAENFLPIKAE